MKVKINIFTAIIVLIVGLYDLSYGLNRRKQPNNRGGIKAFVILGIIFTIGGLILLLLVLTQHG